MNVLCGTYKALGAQDQAFQGALDWMQISFMAQEDVNYVRYVWSCRELMEVSFPLNSFLRQGLDRHFEESFLGQYAPEAATNTQGSDVSRIQGGVSDRRGGRLPDS